MRTQSTSKAERFRQRWAEEEARVPKFADALPRSPNVALETSDALLALALEANPALADGDGDLDEHYRVHDFLIDQNRRREGR